MQKANVPSIPRSEKVLQRANCLSGDAVGDFVKITAAKVSNRYQVTKVDPTADFATPAVAVITKKLTATLCVVQFAGPNRNAFTGLTPGVPYYVGTDSKAAAEGDANFPVSTPAVPAFVQQVGWAIDDDEMMLAFQEFNLGLDSASGNRVYQYALDGLKNGANLVFTTPTPFVSSGSRAQSVYWNGVRLEEGIGCDYTLSESGGLGSGFDTITLATDMIPLADENLVIDFDPDV